MKTFFLLIVLTFIQPSGVFSCTITQSQQVEPEQWKINDIENLKREILSGLKNFEIIEKVVEEGRIHIYKKNNQIQLISMHSDDPVQDLTYVKDWYFHHGQLIYTEQNIILRSSGKIIDTEKLYLTSYHLTPGKSGVIKPESVIFKKKDVALTNIATTFSGNLSD